METIKMNDLTIKIWETGSYNPESKHGVRWLNILIEKDGDDPKHEKIAIATWEQENIKQTT